MKSTKKALLPLAILAAPIFATLLQGQEEQRVYVERFVNTTGANAPIADMNWSMYLNSVSEEINALDITYEKPEALVTNLTGDISVEITFDDNDGGAIFIWQAALIARSYAHVTEDVSIDMTGLDLSRITFYNHVTPPQAIGQPFLNYVVVKIDGNWYITAEGKQNTTGEEKVWQLHEIDASQEAANWNNFILNPGVQMAIGDPLSGPLPQGNIEGIGFYTELNFLGGQDSNAIVFDELEVFAVEGGTTEPDMWGPYTIVKQGERDWVDTAPWMGWLDITTSPWNYSLSLDGWVFVDAESANAEAGAWVYVIK